MRKLTLLIALALLIDVGSVGSLAPVRACPGCKEALANEAGTAEEDPAADLWWNPTYSYNYSVLFMLAVPALILVGFGTAFYRLSRRDRPQGMPDVLPNDSEDPRS